MRTTISPLVVAFEAYRASIPGYFKPNQQFYDRVGMNWVPQME